MRRVAAAWSALALAVLGLVVTTGGPAGAQVPCTGRQTASSATVSPGSVRPGETLTLSGSGFAANVVLGIGLFRPPVVLATVASSTTGTYSAAIHLPLGTPPGQNEITVFGHGPNGTCHQSLALFSVEHFPHPPVTHVLPPPTIVVPVVVTAAPVPIVVQQRWLAPAPPHRYWWRRDLSSCSWASTCSAPAGGARSPAEGRGRDGGVTPGQEATGRRRRRRRMERRSASVVPPQTPNGWSVARA
jgi:hypothetical protein